MGSKNQDIMLRSVHNFRDLGGLMTDRNKRIRKGIIYRSANPDKINKEDLQILQNLKIRSIVDLRAPGELAKRKRHLSDIEVVSLPLDFDQSTREKLTPYLKKKGSEEIIADISNSLYIDILDASGPVLKEVMEILLSPERCPVLIHCQAGKDRTGIISALVLHLLGVERQLIIEDFMRSNEALLPFFKKRLLMKKITSFGFFPSDRVLFAITVRQRNIESILDRVENHYGGIGNYLAKAGFDITRIPEFKEKLVDDEPEKEKKIF